MEVPVQHFNVWEGESITWWVLEGSGGYGSFE